MNTLTVLEILANADSIQSAVAQLTANGITPTFKGSQLSDGWYETKLLNFWLYKGQIYVNTFEHPFSGLASAALRFYAQQQLQHLPQQVPASGSAVAAEQPVIPEPSTESVDNNAPTFIAWREPADRFDYVKSYVNLPQLRNILRTERRLRNSQAKGLSS